MVNNALLVILGLNFISDVLRTRTSISWKKENLIKRGTWNWEKGCVDGVDQTRRDLPRTQTK
jgi:hypothetical protein